MALAIVAFSYLLGILNIRVNAWVTGTCLLLEVAALLVIVGLGFGHAQQPASVLLQPQVVGDGGLLAIAPWALVIRRSVPRCSPTTVSAARCCSPRT